MSADKAFSKVLESAHFSQYNLATTDGFVAAVRSAPHAEVLQLHRWLEELAFETEDYGEASGVLVQVLAFGSGLTDVAEDSGLPLDDARALADHIVATPGPEREDLYMAVLDGLARDNAAGLLTPLQRHRAFSLAHYGAAPVGHLRWTDSTATWDSAVPWGEQAPAEAWEVFTSRPGDEVETLSEAWWRKAAVPHDLAVALALEAQGLIRMTRGDAFGEAVIEHLLWRWGGAAADALAAHPSLAEAANAALAQGHGVLWLAAEDPAGMATRLNPLFSAGLSRDVVVGALSTLLASRKGGTSRPLLRVLLAEL